MFGIGFSEMIVIGLILIVAVGPSRMPGMLKAFMRAYREFRKATRELRASTGIDELLQDEDLRAMRKPLYVPPAPVKKPTAKRRSLSYAERAQESPPEGVDLAEARHALSRPSPEEAERIRRSKEEAAERDRAVVAAKLAADESPEAERVRAAKIAAAEREVDPEEAERVRAAKIAAAESAQELRAGEAIGSVRRRAGGGE